MAVFILASKGNLRQQDLHFRRFLIGSGFIGCFHQWYHFNGESIVCIIVIIISFSVGLIGFVLLKFIQRHAYSKGDLEFSEGGG